MRLQKMRWFGDQYIINTGVKCMPVLTPPGQGFNSSRLIDAICVSKIGHQSSSAQIMACRLDGAKPLSEPMLVCCSLDHWNKFQWHSNQNTIKQNAFENVVCKWWLFCLGLNVLTVLFIYVDAKHVDECVKSCPEGVNKGFNLLPIFTVYGRNRTDQATANDHPYKLWAIL